MNQGYNYNMYNNYNTNQNFNAFNMKNKKESTIIFILFIIFILIVSIVLFKVFSGNSENKNLPTENDLYNYIKEKYGDNNKIVSKNKIKAKYKGQDKLNEGYKYIIQSDLGFTYEVLAGISYSCNNYICNNKKYYKIYYNNFYENLKINKKSELDSFINKDSNYKITYDINIFELCQNEDFKCKNNNFSITIDLMNDSNNIDNSCDDLYRIKNELNEKLNINDDDISVYIKLNDKKIITNFKEINQYNKTDFINYIKNKLY